MSRIVLSPKKASMVSNGIFLICVGIMIFTGYWWPGIILAIGATVTARQYLSGRLFQAAVSIVIFAGIFVLVFVRFNFDILAPVLFIIAGIFLIVREYYFTQDTNGEDKADELKEDVDIDVK